MTSDKNPKSKLKGFINFGISVGLAAVFLYIAFYNVNFGEVMSFVSEASLFWIIIFLILAYAGHIVRAYRWKFILHSVKPEASIKNLFGALMVGYGVNCVTPKLGEITRAVLIGKWEGLSRSSMFGTVILERIIDIISIGVAVVVSIFLASEKLSESFPWLESTLYFTAFVITAVLVFLYLIIRFKEKFYMFITKLIGKISDKAADRAIHIFEMLTLGFSSLKGTKNYIYTIGLSVALIFLYAASAYSGFFILEMQNIKPVTFEMGWILMSISAIGVIIPTPGATGSYHTLAKSTLVLLFGFGETISLAYAFITHIISYFLFILTALILFFALNKQHDNLMKVVETDMEEL